MRDYLRRAADDVATLAVKKMALESVRTQIAMLEAEACSTRGVGYKSTPVSGGGNRQEQKWCAYIDRKTKYEDRERVMVAKIAKIERALQSLSDQERTVLDALYCHGTPKGEAVRKLERALHVSSATVYRIRERALWQLACRLGYV